MHPFDHVFRRGTEDVLNVRDGDVPANLVFPEGGGVDAKLVGEVLADTAVFLPSWHSHCASGLRSVVCM